MKSYLVIIRGNSGSGKTTLARKLQEELGQGTLLVSQDVIRREMLRVHDTKGNLSIDLIKQTAAYGKGRVQYVIVEGILRTKTYGKMLTELMNGFDNKVVAYYFDLPFEETLHRHSLRAISNDFGEERMKNWWVEKDYLEIPNEYLFLKDMEIERMLKKIVADLKKIEEEEN